MNRIAMPGFAAILAVLSELLEIGLVVLNGAGEMEYISPRGGELLGCGSSSELSYCYPETRAAVQEVLTVASADSETIVRTEARWVVDEKQHGVSIEAHALDVASCTGYLLLVRDEENVRRMAADMQLSAEFRNSRRVCEAVMHDLKQPIAAMFVHLDLLKGFLGTEEAESGSGALRSWSVIRSQCTELNRMLTLMLEELSPSTTEERGFSLRDVVQDVARLIEPEAEQQNVLVELVVPEHAARLNGSRQLVKQSILNISLNALDAMRNGGVLRIELEVAGDGALLRIRDTGTGIQPRVLPRVFDMHYTTKESGMGIGLYVAREVIAKHGGDIAVESRMGRGTVVTMRLPVQKSPS